MIISKQLKIYEKGNMIIFYDLSVGLMQAVPKGDARVYPFQSPDVGFKFVDLRSNKVICQIDDYTQVFDSTGAAWGATFLETLEELCIFFSDIDISFFQKVAEGKLPPYRSQRKFGYLANVSTTEQLVADIGGNPYQPTAAATVEVISTSANDTAAGTGAQKVVVLGLDQNWNEVSEEITMNGLAASAASTTTFIRVFRTYVSQTGTYAGSNLGQLTVRVSGGGTSWLIIPIGQGQTKHCFYSVPAGKTMYIYDVHLQPEGSKSIAFNLWALRNANDVVAPYLGAKRTSNRYPYSTTPMEYDYTNSPLVFQEYTDVWVTAQISTGNGATSAEFIYLLKTN